MICNAHKPQILKGLPAVFGQQPRWLRGVDLNHRPLGYEGKSVLHAIPSQQITR